MTRATVAVLLLLGVVGCREEPTIVIKFEPNDMTGIAPSKPGDMTAPPTKGADLAVAETTPKKGFQKKGAAPECKVAADCVVEPLDCCDCANGGKQHAIAKKAAAAAKATRAAKCRSAVCTMMLSTDPSCGQRADCVDGACVMATTKK